MVSYWCDATDQQLAKMGADATKRPSPERIAQGVMASYAPGVRHAYSIWEVDGRAIGYACLKDIEPGHSGSIHLHVWEPSARGQGHGAGLFCRSVVQFYEDFGLRSMICEPSATNPAPNRMLARIGFPLVESRFGRSSDLSAVTQLNRYDIASSIAREFLG